MFGIPRTNVWYSLYQRLVFLVQSLQQLQLQPEGQTQVILWFQIFIGEGAYDV